MARNQSQQKTSVSAQYCNESERLAELSRIRQTLESLNKSLQQNKLNGDLHQDEILARELQSQITLYEDLIALVERDAPTTTVKPARPVEAVATAVPTAPPDHSVAKPDDAATAPAQPAEEESQKLSEKQHLALLEIVSGKTNTEAAQAAGVDRRTIARWLQQQNFQIRLQQYRSRYSISVREKLAGLAEDAVSVVQESLQNMNSKAALKLLDSLRLLNGKSFIEIDTMDEQTTTALASIFPNSELQATNSNFAPATPLSAEPHAVQSPADAATDNAGSPVFSAPCDLSDLEPKQQLAIRYLLTDSLFNAAEKAGVSYSTLHRWTIEHAKFGQVLRACREEQARVLRVQLLNMSCQAIEVLRYALKQRRDVRVAFAVLQGLSLLPRTA